MLINALVVAILTSYRWPMGDEGKQAMLQGGVAGPPPYPPMEKNDRKKSSPMHPRLYELIEGLLGASFL